MLATTTTSERTGHWIKMRPSLAPFSGPESLVHTRSLADFITTTFGCRFSVHTGPQGTWVGFSTSSNWEETMPEKQIFEIPQQLRELAQKNVEQARAAYGQFMDAMTQAVSAWSSASSDTVTSAFKDVQDGAIRFAKENAEAGFALANELTKARD